MTDVLRLADGTSVRLYDGLRIGRDPRCGLHLDDPAVSREHAQVTGATEGLWHITDLGSRNGTIVDDVRIAAGATCRLRHRTRVQIASIVITTEFATGNDDPGRTASVELPHLPAAVPLSPYQLQVVKALAEPWLDHGNEPASNAAIAASLGTPDAVGAVKAALRRAYAKAGLSGMTGAAKRRSLCRVAQEQSWI